MTTHARLAVAAAVAVALLLWVTACTAPDALDSPGYVSGDGTVTEWAVGSRPGPVDVTGVDLDGKRLDLSEFRGQVVILTTWYAACPPCRAEAPDLIALDAIEGVAVVGVNVRDDAATAQAFVRGFDVTYPTFDGSDGTAIQALQELVAVRAVPTALILDAQGNVAARTVGRVEASTMLALAITASDGAVPEGTTLAGVTASAAQ